MTENKLLGNRYQITEVLGSGSFSTVYLARDLRLGQKLVAVKEFNPASFPPEDQAWARQTIRHEAHLRASLSAHPYLADVTDYFEADGRDYLVMEYVEGQNLRRLWEQQPARRFEVTQVLSWAAQLLSALSFLHGHEPPVIYRDLKPENIIVRPDGTMKLIDFGIARFHSGGDKKGDTVSLGTIGYAAPEQFGQSESDERTDIYALGVLLHQLLSGLDPTQYMFRLPPLAEVRPDMPAHLALAIEQARHVDPERRFRSAAAFAGALGLPLSGTLPPEPPMPPVEALPPGKPSWRLPVALALAVLLIGFGVVTASQRERSVESTTPVPPDTDPTKVVVDDFTRLAPGTSAPTEEPTPLPPETATATLPAPTETATAEPAEETPEPPTPVPQAITFQDRPIVFDSDRSGDATNVFIMNWDGSSLRQLTSSRDLEEEADLSPDGQRIAYERRTGNDWYIYVMDVNGLGQQRLVPGREPDWSPDGRYLAYESAAPGDIMLYDFASGGVRELYRSPQSDRAPSWSPDGQRLTFMSEVGGFWQLFVVDVNTGQAQQLTTDAIDKRFPVWSPDGDLMAYNTVVGTSSFQVWTIAAHGGNARQMTDDGSNGRPAWSPDGKYILFNSNRSGAWRIWRMDRDGANQQRISPEGVGHGDQRPDWGAHRLDE